MSLEIKEMQQRFQAAVLSRDDALIAPLLRAGNVAARIAVHRGTVRGSLVQALVTAFPVTERVVGPGFFAGLADRYVAARPPRVPQLSAYGDGFADFIAADEAARPLPYLADVARLEWARSESYFAADALPLDPAALAALSPDDMDTATLRLHPATRLVDSRFPICRIWKINQPNMAEVPEVNMREAQTALVTRRGDQLVTRALTPGDAALVMALAQGTTLGQAVAAAMAAEADFGLQRALQAHFINGTFRA